MKTSAPLPLPIDALIPEILASLEKHYSAVVTAEPGAGKTTRIPPALLSASFAKDREIWVLQPRRLAAKLAAKRVSEERGEEPGQSVGYQFRFEKKVGPQTRLRFMTDGMLFPLSQSDPNLAKVAAVVLDEFHERSLALELGLAWLRRLQLGPRPDLRLLVMSATLDAGALSAYLSDCPVFKSSGRVFPVTIEYHPFPQEPDLSLKVKSAVRQVAAKGLQGTTLVFLPGLAEIKRCQLALRESSLAKEPMEVHALYGDLSVQEQQAVLSPTRGNKVILSTNLAETSLTVPGVTTVIDSGLTRQSRVSAWSGLPSLVTVPASQASAVQRAGRAGRLQAGLCLRLFTKFDFDHRAAFDVPEISRSDLSKSLLDLLFLGVGSLDSFPWFLKPSPAALEAAQTLLRRLGAQSPQGLLTEMGRRMSRIPLPPRLGKFLLQVEELAPRGSALLRQACRLAALISEEKPGSEDLLEELRKFNPGFEGKRLEEQLAGYLHLPSSHEKTKDVSPLAKGLLAAFPDRVARVRSVDSSQTRNRSGRVRELLLSSGGMVLANDNALTREQEFFVVVEAQEGAQGTGTQVKVRSLCPIEIDWLLDLFPDDLVEEQTYEWNEKAKRVEGFKRLKYGQLVLDEKPLSAKDFGPEAQDLLLKEAMASGPTAYCDPEELALFLNRVKFVAGRTKEFHEFSRKSLEETLRELCLGCRGFEDLKAAGFVAALRAHLPPKDQALLEKLAPSSLVLSSGRRIEIHYEEGKPPWGESRIQDFFGSRQGPTVAGGAVPVVLHLLSPAKRPVQVTSD
ncbi:MAG TPA: ATP-dependent helicase HrpB, partial [bacterium]|nr:ATP-dependent helicase HrpB [bacterium]